MPKLCTVCAHPAIAEIDRGLLSGVALRTLAAQYGLSPSALFRHTKHVARRLKRENDHQEHRHLTETLDKLDLLEVRLNRLFTNSNQNNSYHIALGCIQEHIRLLALIEKVRHQLHRRSQ